MCRQLMYKYKWQCEFVPYQEALELSELGYRPLTLENDYESYGYFYDKEFCFNNKMRLHCKHNLKLTINAPLFQQAFVFFMERYDINQQVRSDKTSGKWKYDSFEDEYCLTNLTYDNFHQARLALLQQMITFVKTNKL